MPLGRPFAVLQGVNAASNLADGVAFITMPLLVSSFTDDARPVAALAATYAIVRLAVVLPIGVWVDRIDRRLILAWANVLRGALVLLLAVCLQLGVGGLVVVFVVYAVAAVMETAADAAAAAIVPGLVATRDLDRANGRISATQFVVDEFFGPPLGGLLFALSAALPVLAMGGLWAAAGVLALALPIRSRPRRPIDRERRPSVLREAVTGARWLAGRRVVGGLALVGGLASIGYMLPFSVLVLFARERLGLGDLGFGVVLAVSALGGLVGAVIAAPIRDRLGYRWTIGGALTLGAVSLLTLAIVRSPVVAAVLLAAYICHASVWGVCAASLRQRLVPDSLRGRVGAATKLAALIGLAIGAVLGGVFGAVDIALPVAIGGVVFVCCALLAVAVTGHGRSTSRIRGPSRRAPQVPRIR